MTRPGGPHRSQPQVRYAVGFTPARVTSGDHNRNGKLDPARCSGGPHVASHEHVEPQPNRSVPTLFRERGVCGPHIECAVGLRARKLSASPTGQSVTITVFFTGQANSARPPAYKPER
jgi:hypothetical protein